MAINDARVREILMSAPTVAVLGINDQRDKAAYYVPAYLHEAGYRVIGVNPKLAGTQMFGGAVQATLTEIAEPVDLVDVFRRPEAIPAHIEEILAMKPRPRVVWFQLGIENDDAAAILEASGITVVQNRCTMADHQRLHLRAPTR